MKKAFVICCNDSVEFVVLDNGKEAKRKMDEIKKQKGLTGDVYYWHIHEGYYEPT